MLAPLLAAADPVVSAPPLALDPVPVPVVEAPVAAEPWLGVFTGVLLGAGV